MARFTAAGAAVPLHLAHVPAVLHSQSPVPEHLTGAAGWRNAELAADSCRATLSDPTPCVPVTGAAVFIAPGAAARVGCWWRVQRRAAWATA